MAYVPDHARKWSPRRRDKTIERSLDRALEVSAKAASEAAAQRGALIAEAVAAVDSLPEVHFVELGAKLSISSADARANLLRLASSQPVLTLKAVTNTKAKLADQFATSCGRCLDWRSLGDGEGECWSADRLDGDLSKGPAGFTAATNRCEAFNPSRATETGAEDDR